MDPQGDFLYQDRFCVKEERDLFCCRHCDSALLKDV